MGIERFPFPARRTGDDFYVFISDLFVEILLCQMVLDNEQFKVGGAGASHCNINYVLSFTTQFQYWPREGGGNRAKRDL